MRRVVVIAVVTLSTAGLLARQSQEPSGSILVQMSYFAKPGREDEVLRLRLRAAEVLEKAKVGRGRVWKTTASPRASGEAPTVIWEGEFASEAALKAYEEVADMNADFLAIRRAMTDATVKVERRYFRESR